MARRPQIAVKGIRQLMKANTLIIPYERKRNREALRKVGEVVREDTAGTVRRISSVSAAGWKTKVLQRGIVVSQTLRTVTGKRGDYGAWQMRVAVRSAKANEQRAMRELELALDDMARHWEAVR